MMSTFSELNIPKHFISSLNDLKIEVPTEIQSKTIPVLLNKNQDFIGMAQTGTGKTIAFGIPILNSLKTKDNHIQALILAPTRELVQQIKKQLFKLTKYCPERIFTEAVYGGEKIEKQINSLKRPTHVLVATPGRLLDLIERGEVDLSQIRTLVLDEADEMLSMGFKQDLNRILKYTRGSRTTWLFSATMPQEIQKIIKTYMSSHAERIEIDKNTLVNANIRHTYVKISIKNKVDFIINFLDRHQEERGIIFCRTKAGTQNLTRQLVEEGFSVGALEGGMQQKERDKVMRAFKNGNIHTLVSTDVSARGIDVHNLAFIIHHQLPEQSIYYTHRSGRTARAGKTGNSIACVLPNEMLRIKELEQELGIKFREYSK